MADSEIKKIDAVFEGGGVKGSAFVGAIEVAEKRSYVFENLAGTSAGALVAALLAAGYKSSEIKKIMDEMDYSKFRDETMLDMIPILGKWLELILWEGIYKGDYIEKRMAELLAQKGIKTFKDLIIEEYKDDPKFRYKLQVVASDITNGKLLVLPRDAADYGINPDDLEVSKALRMSISIPFFYRPVIWQKNNVRSYIVDGGILSNFPVWILDDDTSETAWPTFGFKLMEPTEGMPAKIAGPIDFFKAMFETMVEAHDTRYITDSNFARTIPIPTLGVRSTDFGITATQREALYESGKNAAAQFFDTWDFEKYKQIYKGEKESRTKRVWEN
jgi:NTE family protein